MVFEMLGHNLPKLISKSNYNSIPRADVKSIIWQILEWLNNLHTKFWKVNTDAKPENVLFCVDETHRRRLISFESP
jgi:serine/threonine protein kinase